MTQCAGVLAAVPGCYLLGGGQVCGVDVNDCGVGDAEFLHASQRGDCNLLGKFQRLVIGQGKTYVLLKPCGACGLDVYALVILADETAHDGVD